MAGLQREGNRKGSAWLVLLLAIALIASLLGGCSGEANNNADSGSASSEMADMKNVATSYDASASTKVKADTEADREAGGEAQSSANGGNAGGGGVLSGTSSSERDMFNAKIIYTANLVMQVKELAAAAVELRNHIHMSDGYILEFKDTRHDGEIAASYTIKVPAEGFMSFLDRIAEIDNLSVEKSVSGKDVSEEYVDLESRLKSQLLVEERLLSMMEKATKADDLLKFSNQLAAVQEIIEGIKGRLRYLDNNVAFSTIHLRIYQKDQKLATAVAEEETTLGGKLNDALTGSTSALLKVLEGILIVLVAILPFLPIAALVIAVAWLAGKLGARRRTGGTKAAPSIGYGSVIDGRESPAVADRSSEPNGEDGEEPVQKN
ncbi:DUF4349 domain-containing protein [Paenibacillus sp. J5C_2022]|uniref:DUF4349 domain-containing protein n=1 Tax=Paenibacillus sp. J5C2022 TaxID=2977129 RepID=UPI0021CEECAC|nr:DUF4349 domain-containing protein [Paenibacillus sp. J5C2022]MCU6709479.1 DUF4349 domain-containing protein [Paenibacillus sp. J5C2022]